MFLSEDDLKTRANVMGMGLAAAASGLVLFLPIGSISDGDAVSVFSIAGSPIILWLVLPVAATALPLIVPWRGLRRAGQILAAVILVVALPLGYFILGIFYLPSLVAMIRAALL